MCKQSDRVCFSENSGVSLKAGTFYGVLHASPGTDDLYFVVGHNSRHARGWLAFVRSRFLVAAVAVPVRSLVGYFMPSQGCQLPSPAVGKLENVCLLTAKVSYAERFPEPSYARGNGHAHAGKRVHGRVDIFRWCRSFTLHRR